MNGNNSNGVPDTVNLDIIRQWLQKGDYVKIATELKQLGLNRQTVAKVLNGERRTHFEAIVNVASRIAKNRKKLHDNAIENIKAMAS